MKISSQLVLKLIILFALFVAIAESKKKKFKLFGKKKKKGKKAVTTTTSARRAAIASAKAQRKPPVTRSQVTARPTNKKAAKKAAKRAAKAKRSANKTASPRRNAAVAAKMQPTGPYHKKTNLKLVYKTLLPPGLRRPENNIVFEFTDNEDGKTCRCICRTK
jgi:FtsZ-interacting cell division protein ZipA